VLLAQLIQRSPEYRAETWCRYDALYRGGWFFRQHVRKFLTQNPLEPGDTYATRCDDSAYRSYVGPIVDFFAAQLMASPMTISQHDAKSGDPVAKPDQFYSDLKEDVDGAGTDLVEFCRASMRRCLVKQGTWWLASKPEAGEDPIDSLADYQEQGLDAVRVERLEQEDVVDWELAGDQDEDNAIAWALTYSETTPRRSLLDSRKRICCTWRLYDREFCETFVLKYDVGEKLDPQKVDVPSVSKVKHGFTRIPLLRLELPEGLWLLNRVAESQVEHFRLNSGLGWAIRRTCYAMPVFACDEDPKVMGPGYFIRVNKDESMTWSAPPSDSYEVIQTKVNHEKDEIYRVSQQMAQGVDNNAAAVGRSGASKLADANATEVCLKAYGAFVRDAVERLLELVSDGRGDKEVRFSVEGLEHFNLADATQIIANAQASETVSIPSPTHRKEMLKKLSETMLPGLDQVKKDAISQEIDAGVDEAEKQKTLLKTAALEAAKNPPPAPPPNGAPPPPVPPAKNVKAPNGASNERAAA
jgi:hypothetical protein